jgi:16S rRNA (cytosine967-C5)-methyltransferase
VRPGGRVVYSTCSLELEENEAVVAAILEQQLGVRVSPMRDRIIAMAGEGLLAPDAEKHLASCVTMEGYLRLLPGAFGTDGFFIALLEKTRD